MPPKTYLRYGWMSCVRFPKDSNARINPQIGMGIFLIKFMFFPFNCNRMLSHIRFHQRGGNIRHHNGFL